MDDKPRHLQQAYGAQFCDPGVAEAYYTRPPYPPEVFGLLGGLIPAGERRVLELGCGTGDLTLGLAPLAGQIDAVDPSAPMLRIAQARAAPGITNVRFIASSAEAFEYAGPYQLAVAAESLHWMDWKVVLPAVRAALAPGALLALVIDRQLGRLPWSTALLDVIARHSTSRDYRPYDIVAELTSRGLFHERGRRTTQPIAFAQPVADYIESFHSRNGFSRERMGAASAAAFDTELAALVAPHCAQDRIEAQLSTTVVWGEL